MKVKGYQAFNQIRIVLSPGTIHCHLRCWDLDIIENRRTEIKDVWDGLLEKDIRSHKKGQNSEHKIRNQLQYHKDPPSIVRAKKLKYFGHVNRMDNNRYPKILLEEHTEGNRPRGRPEKKWLEDIRHFCEREGIPSVAAAGHLAINRDLWRLKVVGKPSPGPTSEGRL